MALLCAPLASRQSFRRLAFVLAWQIGSWGRDEFEESCLALAFNSSTCAYSLSKRAKISSIAATRSGSGSAATSLVRSDRSFMSP